MSFVSSVPEQVRNELTVFQSDIDGTLLLAVDHGSRDARMHYEGSDFDVGVLVANDPATYTGVDDPKSRFRRQAGDVSINGYPLKRFTHLVTSGRFEPLSIAFSETTYFRADTASQETERLISYLRENFDVATAISHYRTLARDNHNRITSPSWEYNGVGGPQWTVEENGGEKMLTTGLLGYPDQTTSRPVSEAIESGVLEKKNPAATVTENIRVARSLLSAKFVRETYLAPPSDIEELVEYCAQSEDIVLPRKTADKILALVGMRQDGLADKRVGYKIDEWASDRIDVEEFTVDTNKIRNQHSRTVSKSEIDEMVRDIYEAV